tara:strand:- start:87 stop:353 length:267 start_codon:yes stop_codon:yes gene_type:complete
MSDAAVRAALSPVVQAGFDAGRVRTHAKYAEKGLEIQAAQQRVDALRAAGAALPQASSGPPVVAYVFLGITIVIAIIVGLVFLVNRTI